MIQVYVEQYGYWWKLSLDQWKQIIQGAIKGDGYELPQSAQLKIRPRTVGATEYGGETPSYFSRREDVVIYSPLDWDTEDFKFALEELQTLQQRQEILVQRTGTIIVGGRLVARWQKLAIGGYEIRMLVGDKQISSVHYYADIKPFVKANLPQECETT
jgi:hypothetical protein